MSSGPLRKTLKAKRKLPQETQMEVDEDDTVLAQQTPPTVGATAAIINPTNVQQPAFQMASQFGSSVPNPFQPQPQAQQQSGFNFPSAAAGSATQQSQMLTVGGGSQSFQIPPAKRPTTTLSHSQRVLRQKRVFQQSRFSLPTSGQQRRVVVPDTWGIERSHPVSDAALQQVRAIISADQNQPRNPSFGSLPSGTSQFSSASSFGSLTSQGSSGQFNIDPVNTIRQQSQVLLQQGHTDDIDALIRELLRQHGQSGQGTFHSAEVSQNSVHGDETSKENYILYENTFVNGDNKENIIGADSHYIRETSSDDSVHNVILKKPKFYSLRRVFSRLFKSKL